MPQRRQVNGKERYDRDRWVDIFPVAHPTIPNGSVKEDAWQH